MPRVRYNPGSVKRLARILLNAATALSLILFAATVVLCVRSYWVADAWGWSSGKRSVQCGIASGRLRIDASRLADEGGSWGAASRAHSRYRAADDPPTIRLPTSPRNLGFAVEHRIKPKNYESFLVLVPLWVPLLILCGAVALFRRSAKRSLREQRRRAGACPHCGYDLRATPERCPECGTIPAR
jgi:hypothetical protein